MRALGIDHGERRIGIAISDDSKTLARPLTTIMQKAGSAMDELVQLISHTAAEEGSAPPFLPNGLTLEQFEDKVIEEALRRAGGNKSQAARLLGLSRNALRYRLSKIGVPDEPEEDPGA